MSPGERIIMLVAGEASGDLHGATLARALRGLEPGCRLVGMGGARMAGEGVELLADVTSAAAAGGTEAIGRVPLLFRTFRRLRAVVERSPRPAAVVLIDFPEFNLRLARVATQAGIPVIYFIPPQLWAWRGRRIRTIRRFVSLVLAVFPFELPLYRHAGVPVEFVGHPLLDALDGVPTRAEARRQLGVPPAAPMVGLLPGSRREEVERLLPAMREAVRRVALARPDTRFAAALAPTVERAIVERHLAGSAAIAVVDGRSYTLMRAADLLLVASGTATLEAALLGTPMIVAYRLSRPSELMARLLVRVPWISLANLTLGRSVVPELYQDAATGERLAGEALRLLGDAAALEAQREAFRELGGQLGEPGVGARAARLVLETAWAA